MDYKNLRDLDVEIENNILWIYFNRPKYSNAFSTEMIEDLCQLLTNVDYDNNIRCIVFSGRGKCFNAGGDIKAMANKTGMFEGESNELRATYQRGIQLIPKTMEALQTPTIAMVNGPAIGAGCDFTTMCDFRFADENAKFGVTFSRLNLVPGDGGTYFLPRVVGYTQALEMYMTGKIYSASEAQKFGLIKNLSLSGQLREDVLRFINELFKAAPMAQSMIKKSLKLSYLKDLQTSLDLLAAYQGIAQRSDDHFEGLKSFSEKREPSFQFK